MVPALAAVLNSLGRQFGLAELAVREKAPRQAIAIMHRSDRGQRLAAPASSDPRLVLVDRADGDQIDVRPLWIFE